jgi:cytochrome c peroxidase
MQIWSAAKSSLSYRLSRLISRISAPRRPNKRWIIATVLTTVAILMTIAVLNGEQPREDENRMCFANSSGVSQTFSTMHNAFDPRGPFFQSMGTNGRSCSTCHQPSDGMSIAPASIQQRFRYTRGQDPLFRTVDGSNCNHNIDVSTPVKARRPPTAYC